MIDKFSHGFINRVYEFNDFTLNELLCKLAQKMDEVITQSNESFSYLDWLKGQGLSEEVIKTLLEWKENGTLENIINKNLFNGLNTKIDEINTQLDTKANINEINEQLETKVNKNEIYLNDYNNNNDIDNIKSALNLSQSNGKNIIFDTRTYIVDEDIILNGVNCDFRNGVINLNGNSLILANDSSLINCNIVNGGVILRNGKNRIANITIKNFTTALTLDVGNYESFINKIVKTELCFRDSCKEVQFI